MSGSSCTSKVFPTRQHTLSLYRRIMKLGSTWKANIPSNTAKERAYIRNEARAMFHENKELDDVDTIEHLLEEAEQRVDIAEHYNVPYTKATNLPPQMSPEDLNLGHKLPNYTTPSYTPSKHPVFD